MNWKRFAKKNLIPFYNSKDLITKVKDYGFVEGVKEKFREDWLEDTPIVSHIYDMGKDEGHYFGKKEGYRQASDEYEKKLLKQAEEFLNQKLSLEMNIEKRNQLLDEYEKCIEELDAKCESLTREQLILLNQLKSMQNRLITWSA